MASKTFYLEIVTPRRIVYKGNILSLSVPGVAGGFQVLYNHAPLLSSLDIGSVRLTDSNGTEYKYAVSGGFVEVRNNNVVLLAETAERTDEIDIERADAAKERAEKLIIERKSNTDIERAKLALQRALNRLKIAESARN